MRRRQAASRLSAYSRRSCSTGSSQGASPSSPVPDPGSARPSPAGWPPDGATIVVNDMNDSAAKAVADEVGGDTGGVRRDRRRGLRRRGRRRRRGATAGSTSSSTTPASHRRATRSASSDHGAQPAPPDGGPGRGVPPARRAGRASPTRSGTGWSASTSTARFHGTRAALRHMTPARSGAIVNISSVLGLMPAAGRPALLRGQGRHHRPHQGGGPGGRPARHPGERRVPRVGRHAAARADRGSDALHDRHADPGRADGAGDRDRRGRPLPRRRRAPPTSPGRRGRASGGFA